MEIVSNYEIFGTNRLMHARAEPIQYAGLKYHAQLFEFCHMIYRFLIAAGYSSPTSTANRMHLDEHQYFHDAHHH